MAERRGGSDLAARVLVALVAIPIAIFLVWQGGEVLALGLAVLGVIALGELYTLMERVRPPALAGFLTLVALLAAALYGEQRISNYLLWQLAYAEFVFVDELWPDFSREVFEASLEEYTARQRRFGAR